MRQQPDNRQAGWSGMRANEAVGPIVIIGTFGVTLGITYPLLAYILKRDGASTTVVGLNGAMTPLGMVLTALIVPALVRRVGPWWMMMAASMGVPVVLAVLALSQSLWLWFVLRFVLGACAVAMFILSETWISEIATTDNRARLMTAYSSILALGFALGPAVLAVSHNSESLALLVAIGSPLFALLALRAERQRVPHMAASGRVPLRPLVTKLSVLPIAVLAVSVFDAVTLHFLPLYGELEGMSPHHAHVTLAILLIGQMIFQYPLGWLADRMGGHRALIVSLTVGAAGALLLPAAVRSGFLLWPMVLVWGGIAFAGYPLVLALLGESLSGTSLLLGNTAFAVMWGIGGVLGPPYAGAAIDWLGSDGMPWSLAVLWILALGVTGGHFYRVGRRKRGHQLSRATK